MKTCWQILEIESTTQIDIIRQAYLARLPLCHPETDPQGFKALRRAYEEALRLAVNPVEEADDEEKDAATEHEILRVFRALLDSENDRFQPSAAEIYSAIKYTEHGGCRSITLAAVCNRYRSAISFIKLCFFAGRAFELAFV